MGHSIRGRRTLVVLSVILAGGAPGHPARAGERAAGISVPAREVSRDPSARPARAKAPRLRLVWIDVLGSAPFAFPAASREASAILADAGVDSAWTLGDTSTITSDGELKIVIMPAPASGAGLPARVMGGTQRGARSGTTWIYVSNVLWALGLADRDARRLSDREQADVARALGRVVAHEIVHAVAPEQPHSRDGLMSGKVGRGLLLQARVSLASAEERALRAGVAAFLAAPEALEPVALAVARR